MKTHKLLAAVTLCTALVALADEARIGTGGKLSVKQADMEFAVSGFLPGWQMRRPESAGAVGTAGTVPFKIRLGTAEAKGEASFVAEAKGGISARWYLTTDRDVKIEQLYVGSRVPDSAFRGGSYEIDGRTQPFPKPGSNFHFGWGKNVRRLAIRDDQGRLVAQLDFDRPCNLNFQDNTKYGGGAEVRVMGGEPTLRAGTLYSFGFKLSGAEPLELVVPQPVVLTAGKGWLPFSVKPGIVPGSALDFSSFSGIEAPAGRYGRVVTRDGHFAFAEAPDRTCRFYGVNLCFSANFHQTREEAERFAKLLVRLGYNTVRLHHHDGMLVQGSADGTTLNPDRLRELDALVAAFYANGIYVTTDLFVSRGVPYREVGIDRDGKVEMMAFKDLVRTNALAEANLKRFAKSWLTHVNEYTGRRWADEPGLAWISLVNENCPDNQRSMNDAERARMVAAENAFFARMKTFVREELGSSVLLTDLNGWSCNPLWAPCREAFDYVDMHFYVDHPRFIESPWRLPSECGNSNPLRSSQIPGVSAAGRCKLAGKPFTITEWNFSGPGRFRGVGGIATGAIAAMEDWDGLWRFAWSHDIEGVRHPERKPMDYFNLAGDPLLLASERATMCLFLRRDLTPGDKKALAIDSKEGRLAIVTPQTCGAFAEKGTVAAGVLAADLGTVPATVWVSALDERPLAASRRLLLTHLTDVQNSGARYADDTLRILTDWGKLPWLMREGTAEVSLALDPGRFTVYVLEADGSRRCELPSRFANGRLSFRAAVGRDPSAASYLYEIVRQ